LTSWLVEFGKLTISPGILISSKLIKMVPTPDDLAYFDGTAVIKTKSLIKLTTPGEQTACTTGTSAQR
jgi:hypothetical protein